MTGRVSESRALPMCASVVVAHKKETNNAIDKRGHRIARGVQDNSMEDDEQ